jgi:hypothetical protein
MDTTTKKTATPPPLTVPPQVAASFYAAAAAENAKDSAKSLHDAEVINGRTFEKAKKRLPGEEKLQRAQKNLFEARKKLENEESEHKKRKLEQEIRRLERKVTAEKKASEERERIKNSEIEAEIARREKLIKSGEDLADSKRKMSAANHRQATILGTERATAELNLETAISNAEQTRTLNENITQSRIALNNAIIDKARRKMEGKTEKKPMGTFSKTAIIMSIAILVLMILEKL